LGEGSVRSSLENLIRLLILISLCAAARSANGAESAVSHSDALARAVRDHVVEATSWKESEIEARVTADFSGADLPAGETDFSISNKELIATFKHALLPVDVMQNGKTIRTIWVAADIIIRAKVVQAAARMTFGSTVAPADVKEALTEITDARAQYFRACSEVIGKVMRRTLSPGDPLTRDTVTNPLLIHSGDTVRVRLERGPIVMSATAKAEQDGKIGETIRVRNLDFSRSLKATVVGRGEVRIE
jgi:flagella basal body P-ring formation protein FlgA